MTLLSDRDVPSEGVPESDAASVLRDERALYQDLVDAQPGGIYRLRVRRAEVSTDEAWRGIVDAHYSVEFVSERFAALLGITRAEFQLNPRVVPDLVVPEDRADFSARNVEALGALTPFRWEGRMTVRGETRWIRFESLPRLLAGGDVSWTGLVEDVTGRKRVEEELKTHHVLLEEAVRARTEELEAANRDLESFSYSVSHDLRAPLRALDGFSAALLDEYLDRLDDQGRHYLDRIRSSAQRMGQLITDLLNLSRVGRRELIRDRVDVAALARAVATELLALEPGRRADLRIAEGMVARGDSHLLRIVLENLIGNALKFSSTRPDAVIEFGVETLGGERVYFVKDNGVGFDMAYVGKLFTPFQRLHSATEFPGTGIGLSLVHRIVRRHGGRVWAESSVGGGAAFFFTLGGSDA